MLIRNGLTANMSPIVLLGGGFMSQTHDTAITLPSLPGGFGRLAAMPWGYSHPRSIAMPTTAGGMASFLGVSGAGVFAGAIAGGKNAAAALSGTGVLAGTAALIISMLAALTGSGTISSAAADAFLQLAASLAGAGDIEGALNAIGNAAAALEGEGTATATATALGTLAASINVTGDLLTSGNVGAAVWGVLIEAGYSAAQILRIIAAQAAGAATDLEGSNPQFTGLDGTTIRIEGSYADGTRTIDALDGN